MARTKVVETVSHLRERPPAVVDDYKEEKLSNNSLTYHCTLVHVQLKLCVYL